MASFCLAPSALSCIACVHHNYQKYLRYDQGHSETPPTGILAELWKWKNAKILFLFARPLNIFLPKTTKKYSYILHTNSPWACVIKVCSNGCATYIICEIQFEHSLFNANFENLIPQYY